MVNVLKMICTGKILPYLADKYCPLIRRFYWQFSMHSKERICLCFHDVSHSDNLFAITPDEYAKIIHKIKNNIVNIEDKEKRNGYIITFDDGYESLYTVVLPFMEEHKLPFVCFITTDFLNTPGYLSDEQLIRLSQSTYCTVGSHMCSHRKTREMKNDDIRFEWEESKRIIQNLVKKEIIHAALPYGSYSSCSRVSKKIALQSGYKTISNTIATPYSPFSREIFRYVFQKNVNRVELILHKNI